MICILLFFAGGILTEIKAQCGLSTPSFTANLVGSPTGTWTSPSTVRADTCCGSSAPDKCLKFTIFLDATAIGINFDVASGALPPGALFYQINCGPPIAVGTPICLSGAGPHILTFCKPGNNNNTYAITSIPKPQVPDSILVRNGCTATLAVSGFSIPTINWNSIPTNTTYNNYLSCTSGCATVVATPTGTPPPFVDYEVSGFAASPCQASFYRDTVRVYFYSDLAAGINPVNPTICFGSNTALLTATVTGGLGPYTYSWTTGSTNTAVSVGPGTYTVLVSDKTGCPPTTATAVVSQFTLPISANAGPDLTLCKSNPNVSLSGTIGIASGGVWAGGAGSFVPSATLLSTTYIPTPGEISAGSVQLTLTSTGNAGCPPAADAITISFQNPPIVSTAPGITVCANNNLVTLSATVTGFPSTVLWTSTGSGTFASTTNTNTSYTPSATDISNGSLHIIVTTTNNGACPPAGDTLLVTITPKPIVNAGPDIFICSNGQANLNGIVTGPTNTGTWTTLGDGILPNPGALNGIYIPGLNDISTGTVSLILTSSNNGNCLPVKDTVRIIITKLALVNAGPNQVICSSSGSVALSGTVTGGASTGSWSATGSGGFSPSNVALNGSYALTLTDITTGSVIFTLTSTNNGPCPSVSDSVKITIQTIASVNSGTNQFVCSSQNTITLSGNVTGGAGTGSWSASGSGGFSPSNTVLSTSYSLTPADIINGSVIFTLTSTGNGLCPVVRDTVKIKIMPLALVNAGPNQVLCSNATSISLLGSVSGGTNAGSWNASGSGGFSPSNTALNTSYAFTPADVTTGSVIFTLTSSGNAPCAPVSDTVKILIQTIASVNSGSNQSICASQNSISLNGTITGAAGTGSWSASSTGSGGFSPSGTVLNPFYSLTQSDITNGSVTFTLTSTNNGMCPAVRDTVKIKITQLAVVNAGLSQYLCSNASSAALSGSMSGGTSTGAWSSSGAGTFNPGSALLNTSYLLTPGDVTAGSVVFTLSSTNNGPCPVVSDTCLLTLINLAQVNSGPNQALCSSQNTIALNGTVAGAAGTGSWSASGSGSFLPSPAGVSVIYSLTPADATMGFVSFTLTSTTNGPCPAVSDTVKAVVKKAANANAGADIIICSNQTAVPLNGTINGLSTGGAWTSNGSGSFSPNTPNGSYSISQGDINAGNLLLILTSVNDFICPRDADTLKLQIVKNPVISLRLDTTICEKQNPFRVFALVTGGVGQLQWSSSGTGSFSPTPAVNPANYFFTPADLSAGHVTLTLSSLNNGPCGNISASSKITIYPSAKAQFAVPPSPINILSGAIPFTNQSTNATSYKWTFGDGSNNSTLVNPSHSYGSVGFYTVTLVADNVNKCSDTTDQVITIIRDIEFPTAFTPNTSGPGGGAYHSNDYSNDVFFPFTDGVTDYDLMIFNRWGELIFRSHDIKTGWDGYFNGKLCQQDAYVWKANVTFFDGRTFSKTGSITLLR
jgi:gliding motility-associated-like protein